MTAAKAPPGRLLFAVACIAAAMLLTELMLTRIYSVLFFYHGSFFAVSLVMSGLALGGVAAWRWNARDEDVARFEQRLAVLALLFGLMAGLSAIAISRVGASAHSLRLTAVVALAPLPGLAMAGAFLASAFARRSDWIGKLYATDLAGAALACFGALLLMRVVQGPAMLLCPAALAALASYSIARRNAGARWLALGVGSLSGLGIAGNIATDGHFLRLAQADQPIFERWNEHSRVVVYSIANDQERDIVIDRSASTVMMAVTRQQAEGEERIQPDWTLNPAYVGYRLGRPLHRVAVIGVGGGSDLIPPLSIGVERVDGYELNGIVLDLLAKRYRDFNQLTIRPELHLIHGEARVSIRDSKERYDLIQASLTDTWAATASGGFVLSENGLYTLEGWRLLLASLTEDGLLTMTRWLLPGAPAETQRLVSLAVAALEDAGVQDPAAHVLLLAHSPAVQVHEAFAPSEEVRRATILVSKRPFTRQEVDRFLAITREPGLTPLAVPGSDLTDPAIGALLTPSTRAAAIEASPFDISAPTDERPYFFLQVRPADVLRFSGRDFGFVTEITFRGVRVMLTLLALATLLTITVVSLASAASPGTGAAVRDQRIYRWMTVYFLGIGAGYALVQLGLQQRLVLVLGHPTLALSVVLFWMLLGTGAGSALSDRLFPLHRSHRAWGTIVCWLGFLVLVFPAIGWLERTLLATGRHIGAGALLAATGLPLGFAFPIGVRIVAPSGPWAVQKMWAVNGAAAIAGSALSAVIGLVAGSRAVVLTGLGFYLLVTYAGARALRAQLE